MRPTAARTQAALGLLTLLCAWLLACRQPSAEITPPEPRTAEPSGFEPGPAVIVEAPPIAPTGPILDWQLVDPSLAHLVEGERYRVDYDAEHPWSGASSPLVTIVMFYDYQCPYSQRLNGVMLELLQRYPQQLRVVWRQFPLDMHRDAKFASTVALAAHQQGQFALMHEWLFANSRSLSPASVEQQAAASGVDVQLLLSQVEGNWYTGRVEADIAFGQSFAVRSTPSFFVNGRPFRGAQSREDIDAIIREELLVAERLLSAGATPNDVWARILAASASERTDDRHNTPTPTPTPAPAKRFATKLSGLPERGASKPKVQILMCGDFDCPFCQRSTATLEQLLKDHPGDLAVYFRHHPLAFHTNARAAHRASVAAENQGQFWPLFDALYANQRQRSEAEIEDMAKQLGLDMKRFRRDIADPKTDKRIDEQAQFCEQDLDAKGTPTFFINGWVLTGAQPIAAFEQLIQQELTP
ncbi:DsbA family protein [Enhygromyxa salina]|uniref:DSBA-like thioredoxin domain protein n=1 Tax=Enhygromyxa salina TaxID=215803 RepID=A0A2S9YKK5_9BACT|nr:thioredoxin domain-containing protein [Enhygromyxa salina]PRQ05635.1 DSBA-like thioredoxin domain protein [Enhygromyxa salina]